MANADATLQRQYNLCKRCLERQGGSRAKPNGQCFICHGLMDSLDAIADKIADAARGYEFGTFLIGATLPAQIYEREDSIRARFKIRGTESVKNQLTKELGIRISRLVGKKVEYLKPDLTISLLVDKENNVDLTAKSRPVTLYGRYIKRSSGLPQKQDRCKNCEGRGCNLCNNSGMSSFRSVEGIIAKWLIKITGGEVPKFTWIGSEDETSLVLGNGRPFYVRVINPRQRKLSRTRICDDGVSATLTVVDDEPELQPRFKVKTRILAICEKELEEDDIKNLESLSGVEVSFENRSKTGTKKIYSARARRIGRHDFVLTIVADGGLMIKQLVGGEEYMKPNISEIVGAKCQCITFDIMQVQLE